MTKDRHGLSNVLMDEMEKMKKRIKELEYKLPKLELAFKHQKFSGIVANDHFIENGEVVEHIKELQSHADKLGEIITDQTKKRLELEVRIWELEDKLKPRESILCPECLQTLEPDGSCLTCRMAEKVRETERMIKVMEEENWDSHSMYEWYEHNVPILLFLLKKCRGEKGRLGDVQATGHPLFKAVNRTILNQAETIRRLILERGEAEAKIRELEKQLSELNDAIHNAQEDNSSEVHCSCVPLLKARVKALEHQNAGLEASIPKDPNHPDCIIVLKSGFDAFLTLSRIEKEKAKARVRELEEGIHSVKSEKDWDAKEMALIALYELVKEEKGG